MKVFISDLADKANIKFSTSGLRGLVTDLTDEVCFAYTQAFLQSTPTKHKRVVIGHDLRPSSPRITQGGVIYNFLTKSEKHSKFSISLSQITQKTYIFLL